MTDVCVCVLCVCCVVCVCVCVCVDHDWEGVSKQRLGWDRVCVWWWPEAAKQATRWREEQGRARPLRRRGAVGVGGEGGQANERTGLWCARCYSAKDTDTWDH